jgi:hypothetical protein
MAISSFVKNLHNIKDKGFSGQQKKPNFFGFF